MAQMSLACHLIRRRKIENSSFVLVGGWSKRIVAAGLSHLKPKIPRQKLIDPALLVAVDDGGWRGGEIG